ncbi:MAG: hypothetical protein ACYTXA_24690 [Nostoc sp.]
MGFFANPQKGLVPVGGNFFATPDTPADPRDCDRYPNSPYCGGGFLDFAPVRINAQIVVDECNFGIAIQGTLGFIKLPVLQVVYRNPDCQPPQPPPPPAIPPPQSTRFKLPFICPCNVSISFGATIVGDNFETVPGMGFFSYLADGTKPPIGVIEAVPRYSGFMASNGTIISSMNGLLNDKFLSVVYTAASFSESEQVSGYIDAVLPSFANGKVIAWGLMHVEPQGCKPFPPFIDPPPPPKPPMPECCPGQSNNDQLLKLILQRIGNLPATVPVNIADSTNKTTQTLQSLAEMVFWHVKQMDAITGQYPIPITIKADPNDKNSKDQNLSLPNQAETLAEILGLLITAKKDTHANLIATIKCLGEAGMIKNLATQTFDIAHANAEFLGYKLEQKTRTIPSLFTPNGKNLAETLKETNVDIVSYVNADKTDLQDDLKTLLTMAARWNTQNWRALGTDAAKSLRDHFVDSPQTIANTSAAIKEETFGQFITEVQQGFTHTPGITDTTDPWGNDSSEAPIVRELGSSAVQQAAAAKGQTIPQDLSSSGTNKKAITNIANILKNL